MVDSGDFRVAIGLDRCEGVYKAACIVGDKLVATDGFATLDACLAALARGIGEELKSVPVCPHADTIPPTAFNPSED